MMWMPELRHLRAFVAVAEELNFTRAAERLHLAQQAVSRSVAQLERELGVELLERTTREVSLTAAGAALLEHGREALVAADAAFARAQAVGRGTAGTVRVGITPAISAGERAEVARVLREDAAELSVSFHELRPAELAASLRDRAVDLVLARTAPPVPEVDSAALRPVPAELFVATGHRLAREPAVRLAQLDGERLLTWSPAGTAFSDLLVRRLAAAGARVEPVESRVTGGGEPPLGETGAVAILPAGTPSGEWTVRIAIEDDISLPLVVIWPAGAMSVAVGRVRAGMSTSA
jgi:DNA-binding transcriptional LysR family regulator